MRGSAGRSGNPLSRDPVARKRRAAEPPLERLRSKVPTALALPSLAALCGVGGAGLLLTWLVAWRIGAPFSFWFPDTWTLYAVLPPYLCLLGLGWDSALLGFGLLRGARRRIRGQAQALAGWSSPWRRRGFFSLGLWPLAMVCVAAYFVLGTSNITRISLRLIGTHTAWQDPFFWRLEEPLLRFTTSLPIRTDAWDLLYHNAWTIEATALFALVVLGRSQRVLLQFLLSFILLFYLGRFLGLLTPVMGPAFYQPELYPFLEDSLTAWVMGYLHAVIEAGPEATSRSAVLLGGISAMPSLHVGMVSLTSYWLAVSQPKTVYVVVPWLILVWIATVLLGWHYALDGLGGILTAAGCVVLTGRVSKKVPAARAP